MHLQRETSDTSVSKTRFKPIYLKGEKTQHNPTIHLLFDDVACIWFCTPPGPTSRPPWPSSSWVWPLPLHTGPSSSSQTKPGTLQWDGPSTVTEERCGPSGPPPSGGTHTRGPWRTTKKRNIRSWVAHNNQHVFIVPMLTCELDPQPDRRVAGNCQMHEWLHKVCSLWNELTLVRNLHWFSKALIRTPKHISNSPSHSTMSLMAVKYFSSSFSGFVSSYLR